MKDEKLRQAFQLRIEPVEIATVEKLAASRLHAGDLCLKCGVERLDYDGLLNLSCPLCGPAQLGCFT